MSKQYYVVEIHDGNKTMDIDVSECPVDGSGDVCIEDAAIVALEQLGYYLHSKTD